MAGFLVFKVPGVKCVENCPGSVVSFLRAFYGAFMAVCEAVVEASGSSKAAGVRKG